MDEYFVAPRRDRVILLGGPVSTLFGFSSSLFIHLLLIEFFHDENISDQIHHISLCLANKLHYAENKEGDSPSC